MVRKCAIILFRFRVCLELYIKSSTIYVTELTRYFGTLSDKTTGFTLIGCNYIRLSGLVSAISVAMHVVAVSSI